MHRLIRAGVAVALLVGVLWSGGVAEAAPPTTVTWKVSSLNKGQKTSLSALVSTNSPGIKTWSKSGVCTLTPTKKPTTLTMGATGSCTLTLKIAKSGKYVAKTAKKTITLAMPVAPTTRTTPTVAPTTDPTTTVAPTTGTTVAPTTAETVAPTTTATTVAPTTTTATTIAPLADPAFSLSSSSESKVQNAAIAGYTITSSGGAVASYAISPAAPAGTSFSTSTGLLTGTPTTVQGATDYTITATNATGTATRTFTLTVTLAAPAFSLSSSSESKVQNVAIDSYTISSTGGAIASYSISPSAPAGTSFSTSTGLLTGTPTTVQGATDYTITATNATGAATQTFTLTVTVTAPAFTLSSSSESKVQNVAIVGYTITSTGGEIAGYTISPAAPAGTSFNEFTGSLSGIPSTVQAATDYTITATNATSTATQTFTLRITALACASGVSCTVGVDTGPGGGIVFYYSSNAFQSIGSACGTNCHYLEVAPTTGSSPWTDVDRTWATGFYDEDENALGNWIEPVSGADGTAIGTGYQNTLDIVAQIGNVAATSAAVAALAYRGPENLSDWFLPSRYELNELCKYARNTTNCSGAGGTLRTGFTINYYWSSSQAAGSSAWASLIHPTLGSGTGSSRDKPSRHYVRPVRAF